MSRGVPLGNREVLMLLVVIQLWLVALDWSDSRRTRAVRFPGQRLEPLTVLFLFAVTMAFLLVQLGGMALLPGSATVLGRIQGFCLAWTGRPPGEESLAGRSLLLVGGLTFYLAGFWDYVIHRYFSHHRWFWFTHEYHHLPRQVCVLMPGILVRPFAAVPAFLTTAGTGISLYAILLALGFPLWDLTPVLPVLGFIAIVLTASHSSFLRRWRGVHAVMKLFALTTPHEHLLHHTVRMNGNYGNFTTLWDRVFRTYLDPFDPAHAGQRLGLPYDQDFVGTLTGGWIKLSPPLRRRLQLERYCNVVRDDRSICTHREPPPARQNP